MSDTRMVSGKWVEGLFNKALGPSITHELSAMLKAEGLDLSHPFQHAYPRERFAAWVQLVARELFPGQEQPAALHRLGAKVVDDLLGAGSIKGAIITVAKLAGPRRVLRQLADYVHGQSALKVKLEERSKTEARIELNDGELADFVAGSLESILALVGARSPKVDTQRLSPEQSVLSVRWA